MNFPCKISIIVPVYKVERYLRFCLESIVRQNYPRLEIILVDDGSPDQSGRICDEYARRDQRFMVIHKENGGLSDARNAGLDVATGEYVGFVDSDDYIHPDMYKDLLERIMKHNADIAQCSFRVTTNLKYQDPGSETHEKVIDGKEAIRSIYTPFKVDYVMVCDKLYRRSLFDTVRFPKSKIHEDEATTYRLFYESSKVVVIDKKYYYYYQSSDSIIRSGFSEKRLHYADAIEERIQFLKEKGLDDIYTSAIKNYAQWLLLFFFRNRKDLKSFPAIRTGLWSRYEAVVKLAEEDPGVEKEFIRLLHWAPKVNPLVGFLIYQQKFRNNIFGRLAGSLGLD